jgi:hypothetical protein
VNEAQLRGIDIVKLEAERFGTPEHRMMSKAHQETAEAYWRRRELGVTVVRKPQALADAVFRESMERMGKPVKVEASKPAAVKKTPKFTKEQLRIAMEVFGDSSGDY